MSPSYFGALRALSPRRAVIVSSLVAGGLLALACSTAGPDMLGPGGSGPGIGGGGACDHPNLGCACPTEGATAACGEVIRKAADYVTCSLGTRTCSGGQWGACMGDKTQQVKGAPIGAPGAHTETLQPTPTGCIDNPCDPACTLYTDNGTGVDAGGLSITDAGGITLAVQDGAATCIGLRCNLVTCDGGGTTTVTGTIRDPAGVNPVYNAFVYVPNAALTPFTQGVAPDACGGGGSISGDPIVFTQTAPDGTFTLTNVPVGNNIPIVIQVGHFRRKVIVPTVTACTNNALPAALSRLARNTTEGDLPYIAIASGGCDPLECLLQRIGIDSAEFTQPGGTGRVSFYQGNGGMPLGAGVVPFYDTLVGSLATLKKYDLVFLPCQCGNEYNKPPIGSHDALRDYTTAGGRLFTSHWGREWIENGAVQAAVFPGVANWAGAVYGGNDPLDVYADLGSAKGVAFKAWLLASGASSPFSMTPSRFDVRNVIAPTLSLAYAFSDNNPGHGTPDNITDMSFNTPLNVAENLKVGRVVYADTHASAAALSNSGGVLHQFPDWCSNAGLTPQEKALEFLIFDLSSCVQPFVPPPYQTPVTYLRDYEGVCPAGKGPIWHFFDWQTITPKDSSLVFTVQTADTQPTLPAATLASLATVSGAPVVTWTGADVATALNTIPSKSKAWLRVNITLNPSSDQLSAPTLVAWRQAYDCVDNQ